jgi:HK97 family phage major capsid protein
MDLEKLTGLFYATEELLRDSTALESWMMMAFDEEMRFVAEDAIMQGIGAGQPLGYLNSSSVITVTKETSQANGTIVAENILKMFSRMPARMIPNAVWLVNQDTFPQLTQLNIKVKNVAGSENVGGFAAPIYQPPTNGQLFGTLLGRPVIPVEYAASLGTVGDIQFVDLSQYLMIDKGGITNQSSIHVRFLFDETAFKFTYRVNGQPIHNAAITPYKGSNTLSPYIVLQAR